MAFDSIEINPKKFASDSAVKFRYLVAETSCSRAVLSPKYASDIKDENTLNPTRILFDVECSNILSSIIFCPTNRTKTQVNDGGFCYHSMLKKFWV